MKESKLMRTFDPGNIRGAAFSFFPRLMRLEDYLRNHFSEPMSLQQAADIVGLQRNYFSTWFRKKVGVGFHEWLNYTRVVEARLLLQNRYRAITDVSLDVGYIDLSTFERNFFKFTGTSPMKFKKRQYP